VVPCFDQLLEGNKAYLVVTSLIGVFALIAGVVVLLTASDAGLDVDGRDGHALGYRDDPPQPSGGADASQPGDPTLGLTLDGGGRDLELEGDTLLLGVATICSRDRLIVRPASARPARRSSSTAVSTSTFGRRVHRLRG